MVGIVDANRQIRERGIIAPWDTRLHFCNHAGCSVLFIFKAVTFVSETYESTRRRFGGERGPSACARFRPSRLARAARPRAARGRRQAAVGTSRRRAARRRPKI